MPHLLRRLGPATFALILAGCFGAGPTTQPPAATPGTDASPAVAPSTSTSSGEEPIPTEDLGAFSCDLPIHVDATVPRANIVDVRVGTHTGYDRVAFEFTDGIPEVSLERAEPPFAQDGSGFPLEVEGSSFLRLTMRGGTKQTDDGSSSYDGPTDFAEGFPTLVHLIEGGDFEGQSTWYLGLASEACVRVFTLTDEGPPRLVIDLEQ